MSDLTMFRDYCRQMADTGRNLAAPHTAADVALWLALANEVDTYLALDTPAESTTHDEPLFAPEQGPDW